MAETLSGGGNVYLGEEENAHGFEDGGAGSGMVADHSVGMPITGISPERNGAGGLRCGVAGRQLLCLEGSA